MADKTVTAANVLPSQAATILHERAGATIVQGDVVYKDSSDGYWKLAQATAAAASTSAIGIALNAAVAYQPLAVCTADSDFTPGITMSLSGSADDAVYVVSGNAAGKIAPVGDLAATQYPIVLMIAKSATKAILRPFQGPTILS